jgi:hypothetical protein
MLPLELDGVPIGAARAAAAEPLRFRWIIVI